MSREDRCTLIALGMSSALRDMPTKLRCGLLDEGPNATQLNRSLRMGQTEPPPDAAPRSAQRRRLDA
jgi:hypothetical protein